MTGVLARNVGVSANGLRNPATPTDANKRSRVEDSGARVAYCIIGRKRTITDFLLS
jgi:hypothetical protein